MHLTRLFVFRGGFAVFHDQRAASNATHAFDFREVGPALLSNATFIDEWFTGKKLSDIAPANSVAVPGVLKGLHALHKQHGK